MTAFVITFAIGAAAGFGGHGPAMDPCVLLDLGVQA
jgi:hypothetical protein